MRDLSGTASSMRLTSIVTSVLLLNACATGSSATDPVTQAELSPAEHLVGFWEHPSEFCEPWMADGCARQPSRNCLSIRPAETQANGQRTYAVEIFQQEGSPHSCSFVGKGVARGQGISVTQLQPNGRDFGTLVIVSTPDGPLIRNSEVKGGLRGICGANASVDGLTFKASERQPPQSAGACATR